MQQALIALTGPIAAGKNTVATLLADRLVAAGRRAVVLDLDDVVDTARATADWDVWPPARHVHAVMIGEWFRRGADVVVAVGPFHVPSDRADLLAALPDGIVVVPVRVEAPLEVTWARARADPGRGPSRERDFHEAAHARYQDLRDTIPAELVLDSAANSAEALARRIHEWTLR